MSALQMIGNNFEKPKSLTQEFNKLIDLFCECVALYSDLFMKEDQTPQNPEKIESSDQRVISSPKKSLGTNHIISEFENEPFSSVLPTKSDITARFASKIDQNSKNPLKKTFIEISSQAYTPDNLEKPHQKKILNFESSKDSQTQYPKENYFRMNTFGKPRPQSQSSEKNFFKPNKNNPDNNIEIEDSGKFELMTPLNLSRQRASNQLSFMNLSMGRRSIDKLNFTDSERTEMAYNSPNPRPRKCHLKIKENQISIDLGILELLCSQFEKKWASRELDLAKEFLNSEVEKRLVVCRNFIHMTGDLEKVVHKREGGPGEKIEAHVFDLNKGEEYRGEIRNEKYQGKGTKIVLGQYTLTGHFESGMAYGYGEKRYSENEFYT